MPSVVGSLKSNKLVLQGHGAVGKDIDMSVKDDEFIMKMGNEVLMTVGRDSVGGGLPEQDHEHEHDHDDEYAKIDHNHDDEYAKIDHTHMNFKTDVTFEQNTTFKNNVTFETDLTINKKVTLQNVDVKGTLSYAPLTQVSNRGIVTKDIVTDRIAVNRRGLYLDYSIDSGANNDTFVGEYENANGAFRFERKYTTDAERGTYYPTILANADGTKDEVKYQSFQLRYLQLGLTNAEDVSNFMETYAYIRYLRKVLKGTESDFIDDNKELPFLHTTNPWQYTLFVNVRYERPRIFYHYNKIEGIQEYSKTGVNKTWFLALNDPTAGASITTSSGGYKLNGYNTYGEEYIPQQYFLRERCENLKKMPGSKHYDSYTIKGRWEKFKNAMAGFLSQIERRDWVNDKMIFSGIGTGNIPNALSYASFGPREWATLSTGQQREMWSYLENNGMTSKADVKSGSDSIIKGQLQLIYKPDMKSLPLYDLLEENKFTDYCLFPWTSYVNIKGTGNEMVDKFDFLVSNKRSREQKKPPTDYAIFPKREYDDFCCVNLKYPIQIKTKRSLNYLIAKKPAGYIEANEGNISYTSGNVEVPAGMYYIKDITDHLHKHLEPLGVSVKFNYAQVTQNKVHFEPNSKTLFKLVMEDAEEFTPNDVSDLNISRILGFSKNPVASSQNVFVIGTVNEPAFTKAVLTNPPPLSGLTYKDYKTQYDIYPTLLEAWDAYETKYGLRTFLANGPISGYRSIVKLININLINSIYDISTDSTAQWANSPLIGPNGLSMSVELYAPSTPLCSKQTLKAVRVSRDVDGRLTVEFEPLIYDQVFEVPDTIPAITNGVKTGADIPSYGQKLITHVTENGVTKIVEGEYNAIYKTNKYKSGKRVDSGKYWVGTRYWLKFGKVSEGARKYLFPDQYTAKFATDEFEILDNSYVKDADYEDVTGTDSYKLVFRGFNYSTIPYDGYDGLFNIINRNNAGLKYTFPYPGADDIGSRSQLSIKIGSTKISQFDATSIQMPVIPDLTGSNPLVSFQDVKTSLIDPMLKLSIINKANKGLLKLEKVLPKISNDMLISDFLTICYHLYVFTMSEEHAFTSYVAIEAGDSCMAMIKDRYSSVRKIWEKNQLSVIRGGELGQGYNRLSLHALTTGDNLVHGYDWNGDVNTDGPLQHYWRYPATFEWTVDELPVGHPLKNEKYGGMSMVGRKYFPMAHNLEVFYEIHCKFVDAFEADGITPAFRGSDASNNTIGGKPKYTKCYAWPVYAAKDDPVDNRTRGAEEQAPVFGVFQDSYIRELVKAHPAYDATTDTLGGKRLPRIGYYFMENVSWTGTFIPSGKRQTNFVRPDLMYTNSYFFAQIGEAIYDVYADGNVDYVFMDERQNLGGSANDADPFWGRVGESRPKGHEVLSTPGWPHTHSHTAQEVNILNTLPESDFAVQIFNLATEITPTNMKLLDTTKKFVPTKLIPGNKLGQAERKEKLRSLYKNIYGDAEADRLVADYTDYINVINNYDPGQISALFPRTNEAGQKIANGSVLIGTASRPVRVLGHRGVVATSGGRLTSHKAIGRDGESKLGKYTSYRLAGSFDRLFSTGGNYPRSLNTIEEFDSIRWEANQYDIFAAMVRAEGSVYLLYDKTRAGPLGVKDYNAYISGSASWDLPHNQVDFVLDNGLDLQTFFHCCGLTRNAVERLTKRPVGNISDANIIAGYKYVEPITLQVENEVLTNIFKVEGHGYVVPLEFCGKQVITPTGIKSVIPPKGVNVQPVISLMNPSWVESKIGMKGIQNLNLERLPYDLPQGKSIKFEDPLTHQDYFSFRSLQILADPNEQNWLGLSQKYYDKSALTPQVLDKMKSMGGVDTTFYKGTTFDGFKYPAEINIGDLINNRETKYKTPPPKSLGDMSVIDYNPSLRSVTNWLSITDGRMNFGIANFEKPFSNAIIDYEANAMESEMRLKDYENRLQNNPKLQAEANFKGEYHTFAYA